MIPCRSKGARSSLVKNARLGPNSVSIMQTFNISLSEGPRRCGTKTKTDPTKNKYICIFCLSGHFHEKTFCSCVWIFLCLVWGTCGLFWQNQTVSWTYSLACVRMFPGAAFFSNKWFSEVHVSQIVAPQNNFICFSPQWGQHWTTTMCHKSRLFFFLAACFWQILRRFLRRCLVLPWCARIQKCKVHGSLLIAMFGNDGFNY